MTTGSRFRQFSLLLALAILSAGWGLYLAVNLPEKPYLDYDEAIHGGAGIIVHDFIFDRIHGTRYADRSYHYFNAGLIYWPFVHGVFLGIWYCLFGLGIHSAQVFSIAVSALALIVLFRLGMRHFGLFPAATGTVVLSLYGPFIVLSRTIMLDTMQFLWLTVVLGIILDHLPEGFPAPARRARIPLIGLFGAVFLLSFTRITGWVLGWGGAATYCLYLAIRRKSLGVFRGCPGNRIWSVFILVLAIVAGFYLFVHIALDYDIIAAYGEQQKQARPETRAEGLIRYPGLIVESFNGFWMVLGFMVLIHIGGLVSRNRKLNFLSCHMIFCWILFQFIHLKKLRFLLPWFGFMGLLTAAVIVEWLPAGRRKWVHAVSSVLVIAGFGAMHIRHGYACRTRNTSGMGQAVQCVLRNRLYGQSVMVRSYAAEYHVLILDRPPSIAHLNNFQVSKANPFAPEFIIAEKNSQLDFSEEFIEYLETSGDWRLIGEFHGDETCRVFRKNTPKTVTFE
ncbi:hypothetical protein JXA40_05445 [bacterium]|nr:hypothetical protein [candidate division CSSED10-310 bacterium]